LLINEVRWIELQKPGGWRAITIHFMKHFKYEQEHGRLTDVGESELGKRTGHSKFTKMATWGG